MRMKQNVTDENSFAKLICREIRYLSRYTFSLELSSFDEEMILKKEILLQSYTHY